MWLLAARLLVAPALLLAQLPPSLLEPGLRGEKAAAPVPPASSAGARARGSACGAGVAQSQCAASSESAVTSQLLLSLDDFVEFVRDVPGFVPDESSARTARYLPIVRRVLEEVQVWPPAALALSADPPHGRRPLMTSACTAVAQLTTSRRCAATGAGACDGGGGGVDAGGDRGSTGHCGARLQALVPRDGPGGGGRLPPVWGAAPPQRQRRAWRRRGRGRAGAGTGAAALLFALPDLTASQPTSRGDGAAVMRPVPWPAAAQVNDALAAGWGAVRAQLRRTLGFLSRLFDVWSIRHARQRASGRLSADAVRASQPPPGRWARRASCAGRGRCAAVSFGCLERNGCVAVSFGCLAPPRQPDPGGGGGGGGLCRRCGLREPRCRSGWWSTAAGPPG